MPPPPPDWRSDLPFWFRPGDLPSRPARLAEGIHGNGRLATRRDLAALLAAPGPGSLVLPDATLLVESAADGSTLEPLLHHGLHLPADVRERHVLAVGMTGCGKTQKLILPQLAADLADPDRAVLALDAKGGVLHGYLTALARRHRPGRPVYLVNFKSSERTTHNWNPAQHIATRHEALEIAHAVCSNVEVNGGSGHATNEAFWLFSSVNLLGDALRLLADDPRETASLARAKQVIDHSAYEIAKIGEKHPYSADFDTRYPALRRFLDGSGNVTQQSVVADCAMRLTLFSDEEVARTTSGENRLDLRQVIREGGVLVLEVPEAHSKQLTPLTNLFVSRLLNAVLDEAMAQPDGRLPRPCSIVLDELGSACGKLPDFETRLATLRSRGVAVTGAVQSLKQLEHLYGATASVIDGFSTRLFFGGGLSLPDAKYASEMSGTCTVAATSTTEVRGQDGLLSRSRTRSPAPRPVLLPDEVARPPVHPLLGSHLTIFTPAAPPFLAYMSPAFEQQALSSCLREGVELERERHARSASRQDEITRLKADLGWSALTGATRSWWEKVAALGDFHLHTMLSELAVLGPGWLEEAARAVPAPGPAGPEAFLAGFRAWLGGPRERPAEAPCPTVAEPARMTLTKRVQSNNVYLVRGKDRGREAWYYVLVNKKPLVVFEKDIKAGSINLADYGEILLSGWGKDPPADAIRRAREEWNYTTTDG